MEEKKFFFNFSLSWSTETWLGLGFPRLPPRENMREIDQLCNSKNMAHVSLYFCSPCQRMTIRLGGWYYLSQSFLPKDPRSSTPVCPIIAKAGEAKDSVLFLFVLRFQLVLAFSLNTLFSLCSVLILLCQEKCWTLGPCKETGAFGVWEVRGGCLIWPHLGKPWNFSPDLSFPGS